MEFGESLESLLLKRRLWLVKLEMRSRDTKLSNTKRCGEGLFAKLKDYGTKNATMLVIQRIFKSDGEFYFVADALGLDKLLQTWLKVDSIIQLPPKEIAKRLFPGHVNKPFFRRGDHLDPIELARYFKKRCETVFRNVQEYNMVVGVGAILDQHAEARINGNGEDLKGKIQVYSVLQNDEFLAIINLQSSDQNNADVPERLRMGARFDVWFYDDEYPEDCPKLEILRDRDPGGDIWSATVVSPALCCPENCWTVILRRPRTATTISRFPQPNVIFLTRGQIGYTEKNVSSEEWDDIGYQIPLSTKLYDCFFRVNEDLVVKRANKLIMDTLLGTNPSLLPIRNALAGIPQDHIQRVQDSIIVSDDVDLLLTNLSAMHGPVYTFEGPAGTGKPHVMLALAMMDLGGADFKYPVHSRDYPKEEWSSLFNESNNRERKPINVYNGNSRRQVVILAATNSVADDLTIKATHMSRKIFPGLQTRIVRVHAEHIEKQVVEGAYFNTSSNRTVQVPGADKETFAGKHNKVDDMNADVADLRIAAENLNELVQHYILTRSETVSSVKGVSDPRLKEVSTLLGAAMLGVARKILCSPWATSGLGPYREFDIFWKNRLSKPRPTNERAFQEACRQMKPDALGIAHIVIGTPAVITEPAILTCLHPSFIAVDEASMIRETDLHPIFSWFYPISFGLFGDSRQLGPHTSAGEDENPFHKQVEMSLLKRMSQAGHMATFLCHQRRMTYDIQLLSRNVFYSDRPMVNAAIDREDNGRHLALWNKEQYEIESNTVFLDVAWTAEEFCGKSFANEGNRKVVLDLARKILINVSESEPHLRLKDIVILVGYQAQWSLYIKDLRRLAQTETKVEWNSVRALKIDSIQGNEADIVIFDYVRTEKHGFMSDTRRLNVACSRGRFGFYLVASDRLLSTVHRQFDENTPFRLRSFFTNTGRKAILSRSN